MNEIELRKTIQFILKNIDRSRKVRLSAYKIKNHLINLALRKQITEQEFYKITSILTPQSRSPLWEKYFIEKHQCNKISSSEGKGDFEKNGLFYEYKASGYNQDGGVHIVQIRLWQKCNYLIQSIDDRDIFTFILTHDEMVKETNLLNASVAHGNKTVAKANQHNELRMTLHRNSDDWNRWLASYNNKNF